MPRKRASLPGAQVEPGPLINGALSASLEADSAPAPLADGADADAEPADGRTIAFAAGDGEVGNTLQTYLREIRRAPLLTPPRSPRAPHLLRSHQNFRRTYRSIPI